MTKHYPEKLEVGFNFRLSKAQRAKIHRLAAARKLTAGEFMRQLIDYLGEPDGR